MWRVAQFDTLRLRLVKIAARVVEMKTMIRVHLPTSCPGQRILRYALGRIPRLVMYRRSATPRIPTPSRQPANWWGAREHGKSEIVHASPTFWVEK
jgi:hypothetical protein